MRAHRFKSLDSLLFLAGGVGIVILLSRKKKGPTPEQRFYALLNECIDAARDLDLANQIFSKEDLTWEEMCRRLYTEGRSPVLTKLSHVCSESDAAEKFKDAREELTRLTVEAVQRLASARHLLPGDPDIENEEEEETN